MSNWYGKIIFRMEGIERMGEFKTESEAIAYAKGARDAFDCTEDDDHTVCHDQIKPVDE